MRKITAFVLAMVLALSMCVCAYADTTTLTTTVPSAQYTMTIPADVEIPYNTTNTMIGDLDVEAVEGFAVGKNVQVTVSHDVFTAEGVSTSIPFALNATIRAGGGGSNSNTPAIEENEPLVFGAIENGTLHPLDVNGNTSIYSPANYSSYSHQSFMIHFTANSADWAKALGGYYTAHITFTAQVVAAE